MFVPFLTKQLERVATVVPPLSAILMRYYRTVVSEEIALGKITKKDRVLCIGGGPFPCTALEIARQTGASVCVVDNDWRAVRTATQVVANLNMSDKVTVRQADGANISLEGFSVVHIAKQVYPRTEILERILNHSPTGLRVLVRTPCDCLKCLYAKDRGTAHAHDRQLGETAIFTK